MEEMLIQFVGFCLGQEFLARWGEVYSLSENGSFLCFRPANRRARKAAMRALVREGLTFAVSLGDTAEYCQREFPRPLRGGWFFGFDDRGSGPWAYGPLWWSPKEPTLHLRVECGCEGKESEYSYPDHV